MQRRGTVWIEFSLQVSEFSTCCCRDSVFVQPAATLQDRCLGPEVGAGNPPNTLGHTMIVTDNDAVPMQWFLGPMAS